MIRELVHVSANLRSDGGGAAHLGRVIGRAMRRYASRHGMAFRGLHLPAPDGHPALDGYECFGGSRGRLALRLAALQLAGAGRRALVFDHLGPSRVQAWLPAVRRSRYAVFLLGIEAWRPLANDRRRALARATTRLAISETTRRRARTNLSEGAPIGVLPPCLEPNAAAGALDGELLAAAGSGFVLVVSRLSAAERYKGHDELLTVWPTLRARVPDARLVVVGGGDDAARLAQRAAELGLDGAVLFAGRVDAATLAALYRAAALFAMPSREEGFGLVFLEAMAGGTPCLALAGTAPAEIVADPESGWLVPDGDGEALLSALVECLSDVADARRRGAAGRERLLRDFTFPAFEARFAPHLDALATRRAA